MEPMAAKPTLWKGLLGKGIPFYKARVTHFQLASDRD